MFAALAAKNLQVEKLVASLTAVSVGGCGSGYRGGYCGSGGNKLIEPFTNEWNLQTILTIQ